MAESKPPLGERLDHWWDDMGKGLFWVAVLVGAVIYMWPIGKEKLAVHMCERSVGPWFAHFLVKQGLADSKKVAESDISVEKCVRPVEGKPMTCFIRALKDGEYKITPFSLEDLAKASPKERRDAALNEISWCM
jgi:hypothetical protein